MITKKYSLALALASTSFLSLAMAGSLSIHVPSEQSSGKMVCAYCTSGNGTKTIGEILTNESNDTLARISFVQLYNGAAGDQRGEYPNQYCQIFLVDPSKFSEGDECSPNNILQNHLPTSINFTIADDKSTANVTNVDNPSSSDFTTDPTAPTNNVSKITVKTK